MTLLIVPILLGALAIYAGVSFWFMRRARTRTGKVAVLASAVAIATGVQWIDQKHAEYRMLELCAESGGLTIYRVAENVEGVFGLGTNPESLQHYPYRYYEDKNNPYDGPERAFIRLERLPDGSFKKSFVKEPTARMTQMPLNGSISKITYYITWQDRLVQDRTTHEVYARYRQIHGYGGVIHRFLASFDRESAASPSCPDPEGPEATKSNWQHDLLPLVARPLDLSWH